MSKPASPKKRRAALCVLAAAALVIALLVGLFWGAVYPESGLTPTQVVNQVKSGFGSIMTSIGIVILCGTIIGTILEKTGAALTVMPGGEHWFHTPEQMTVLRAWLDAETERLG